MLKIIILYSITISIITCFNFFPLTIDKNRIFISNIKENKKEQSLTKCFYISSKYNVYSLENMKYPIIEKNEYSEKLENNYILYFNFCGDTNKTCNNSKGQAITEDEDKNCRLEAGLMNEGNEWEDLANLNNSNITGVKITLNSGEKCENSNVSRKMIFTIQCDKNKDAYKNQSRPYDLISKKYDPEKCNNEIIFKSYYACPSINLASIWGKLEEMKIITSIILIILGVVLLLFGQKFEKITITILIFLTSSLVLFVIIFGLMPGGGDRDIIFWVTVVISIVISGFISYFFLENTSLLIGIVTGILGGYLLGSFIYNIFFGRITSYKILIQIVCIIISMVIVFAITYFALDYILIIITSIIGGYSIMRAFTFWIGGYPNESQLIDLINKGETKEVKVLVSFKFYIYIVVWILLTIGGIVFQIKTLKKKEDKDEDSPKDEALYSGLKEKN